MVEFGSQSRELASFCVSVYVLGFAAGPMIFAPLSELYGRQVVYHCCNVGFIGMKCNLTTSSPSNILSICHCLRQSSLVEQFHRVPFP